MIEISHINIGTSMCMMPELVAETLIGITSGFVVTSLGSVYVDLPSLISSSSKKLLFSINVTCLSL